MDNGDFRVYNDQETFQSGNLRDYYVGTQGFGPNIGVYFWKRDGSNPKFVENELLLYDEPATTYSREMIQRFYERKKRLFLVAKPFGSTKTLKRPSYGTIIYLLIFLLIIAIAFYRVSFQK